MATVTITLTPDVKFQTFERPPEPYIGSLPYGELVVSQLAGAVAVKDAANTNVITTTATFPEGWIYRCVEARHTLFGPNILDLSEYQNACLVNWTEDGAVVKETMFQNIVSYTEDGSVAGALVRNPSVSLDGMAVYLPAVQDRLWTDFIDASTGVSIQQTVLVNDSGSATGATTWGTYFRYFMYSIAQYRAANIWLP